MSESAGPASGSSRVRPELRPVSEESYSLRVTLDAAFKYDLDQLRQLLSHKIPNGDLAAVLREAVRCGIEKHGKRRGAVAPTRKTPPREVSAKAPGTVRPKFAAVPLTGSAASDPDERMGDVPASELDASVGKRLDGSASELVPDAAEPQRGPRARRPTIPAAVRREVWSRDGGRCTWQYEDGRRCESRWQLELDHVVPVALGGATTVANLRLACRIHNGLSAERIFGPEHMARSGGRRPGRVSLLSVAVVHLECGQGERAASTQGARAPP